MNATWGDSPNARPTPVNARVQAAICSAPSPLRSTSPETATYTADKIPAGTYSAQVCPYGSIEMAHMEQGLLFGTPVIDARKTPCYLCMECPPVCPTGALMFKSEHDMRAAGTWDEAAQTTTETICPYCGVGCVLDLHVQDNTIVKVTSPLDSSVTEGHLCVKGRFGVQFVQNRGE